MRTKRRSLREKPFSTQRAIHFVGRNLMIAHTFAPSRVALFVLAHYPRAACTVQQVLRAENISNQEQLRVFNATVHMAFGSEIHHVIEAILSKQTVYYFAAANISLDKKAAFIVDILGNGSQISCIRQSIQNHDLHVAMFCQNILNVVCADKSCGTGHQISFHI